MKQLFEIRGKYYEKVIRTHVSGDYFSQDYFDAWLQIAIQNPKILFYVYTKSLKYLVNRLNLIPDNFRFVASFGSKFDSLIGKHNLRWSKVVLSENEALSLGLNIDHDDSSVYEGTENFALLLHGTQPAGSLAAKAWAELKKIGKAGYHNHKRGRGWGGKDYHKQKKKLKETALAS